MERLRISSDGTHLETVSGQPFFYLADTAWTLPQRLKWDDALYFLTKRKSQGFTAIQLVALDPERDVQMRNPAGHPALVDGDLTRPNEQYFAYLDSVLDAAESKGLYVMLLPVWGQLVVGENWGGVEFPKQVTEENAGWFGEWIGRRYKDRTNIIWCLGGDRQPIHKGIDFRTLWRNMAEGLVLGVTGKQARWNEPSPAWKELVLTYHTCFEMETEEFSTMSYWTDDDAWISFISLQSGHGLNTRSYLTVAKEVARFRRLPVIDVEPAYERMPMNWPKLFPLHGDGIVRKRAYWSLLAGSCGHTYGHASVWCSISEKERNEVLDATWFEALSHPGAGQMVTVRKLAEALEFWRWRPDQSLTNHKCTDDCLDSHVQSARDSRGEFALIYLTSGGEVEVNLSFLSGFVEGAWLDMRTGGLLRVGKMSMDSAGHARLCAPTSGTDQDWLFIATSQPLYLEALDTNRNFGETPDVASMSMIWAV